MSRVPPPSLALVPAVVLALSAAAEAGDGRARPVRARYLVTVADDFVVDVYHNGVKVPDAKRTLLEERFGATAERVDVEVREGDWLVFHVVNDRLRWGGVRYFGLAGCFGPGEFGFVSDPESGAWSACDAPGDADRFIARRGYLRHRAASGIADPWADGTPLIKAHVGAAWAGSPVWGAERSTWLKVVVD